jgi:glycerol-3-phosphate dehydrogenase (NAD(P)+)
MPTWLIDAGWMLWSYILGSIPIGLLLARVKGVDIRSVGSGNIGATNVFRSVGKTWGIATFIGDALKGFIPAFFLPVFAMQVLQQTAVTRLGLVCGCAAIAGHNWPLFLQFKGGKGIATSAGVLLGVAPAAVGVGACIWALLFVTTGYVSAASVAAAVAVPAAAWALYYPAGPLLPSVLTVLGAVAIWRHHGNMERLLKGKEHRFDLPWLKPAKNAPPPAASTAPSERIAHSTPSGVTRVCVIGDGGWGTALAMVLHRNGHSVRVWGPFPDYMARIRRERANPKFLPGVDLPPGIVWTADREEAAAGADVAVMAVPSRYYKEVAGSFASIITPGASVVSVTKGLDRDTLRRMSQVASEQLGGRPVAALSGPSLAEEVARGIPTAVVVASALPDQALALQSLFTNAAFRVYASDDVTGVELGGALKNVLAIAAGISDGIGFGDNTKAALITRGLVEITRLGVALDARPQTFAGLSGMGDLVVTCTSRHSRNRMVGERIGRGETIDQILAGMDQVAEGVWTSLTAQALAKKTDIDVPIIDEVCAVLHEGKDPRAAVKALLTREPRPERD